MCSLFTKNFRKITKVLTIFSIFFSFPKKKNWIIVSEIFVIFFMNLKNLIRDRNKKPQNWTTESGFMQDSVQWLRRDFIYWEQFPVCPRGKTDSIGGIRTMYKGCPKIGAHSLSTDFNIIFKNSEKAHIFCSSLSFQQAPMNVRTLNRSQVTAGFVKTVVHTPSENEKCKK